MTNEEALKNVRELGHIFAVALAERVGKQTKSDSDLVNGLVAYHQLNLQGKWDYMDESIDIVVRIAYQMAIEALERGLK